MTVDVVGRPASQAEGLGKLVTRYRGEPGALLSILETLQQRTKQNFLDRQTLEEVALRMNISQSQVYSVVSFYSFFNLAPQGEHTISVCRGTACHTRGSKGLLGSLKDMLGVGAETEAADKDSITTADGKFTIRTVACFGQCAMAPVVEAGHAIHGQMNRQKLRTVVEEVQKEGRA